MFLTRNSAIILESVKFGLHKALLISTVRKSMIVSCELQQGSQSIWLDYNNI